MSGMTAALGTGAFTAGELSDRQARITVTNDDASLIALDPNDDLRGVRLENGELTIDLDDPGINANSIYQFGYFAEDGEELDVGSSTFPLRMEDPVSGSGFGSAFVVRNQSSSSKKVELDFTVNTEGSDPGGTTFVYQTHSKDETDTLVYPDDEVLALSVDELGVGEEFGVSFLVDTTEGSIGDRFRASFSITAGPASQ
ncbi:MULTISPECIES: hypothetical protein [Haloferacaceae]|uniref:DUF1102 domain-containing protein n=1 Tax=Halorubrum glutamatedens TaxID=2707018 RepID=A0ABD5QPI0_9EURY|nr:hypothetical protein [Halobellus captivus]